ncbi:expansin-A13-like [Populus alba x Populus x berolinensis]|nr:expansin-A13-like [Populus alba x Populus x berolinensis]
MAIRTRYLLRSIRSRNTVGVACGYGDLVKAGYGRGTVGLSESMFERGQICGACFELKCVDDLRWCIPGTAIIVSVTNFCAPNYGFTSDGGGKCNPPNKHFVLPIEAFEKIAIWKAANIPVQYRSNVAGAGDVTAVKIKGSRTGWLDMGRKWGQNWHVNANLQNQALSFEVTSSDRMTVISYNVAPKDWRFGQAFEGKQFETQMY